MIEWNSDTYRNIRRHFEDEIYKFPIVYNQDHFRKILESHNGRIIEKRPKPLAIREVVDYLGMNDRYAIVFDNEESELMFILRFT